MDRAAGAPPIDILLIHPPAVKPAEPPLGTAVLLSRLRGRGVRAEAVDANLEAYLHLLDGPRIEAAAGASPPTALHRAARNVSRSLAFLRSLPAAGSFRRYVSAVRHLDAGLSAYRGESGSERLTLGDYAHGGLSEFSPADLARVASGGESTLFSPYFRNDLLPRIARMRPRAVAISVHYRHQVLPAFELAGMVRAALPGTRLYGGGGMFSSWKNALLRSGLRLPAFDGIGFGPGETVLSFLVAGGFADAGYHLEAGGEVEFHPDYGFAPLPDYLSPEPVLPVASSRGCYYRKCAFCPEGVAPTHPYAESDPATFPDLLLDMARKYGVRRFHLTDNAIPVRVLRSVAERGERLRGISWHGFARFGRELLDPGFAASLAASGCSMLQLGLESGSQALLDRMGKGTRVEEASAILRNLSRAGIDAYVYVMLGAPGETERDAERTHSFLSEHAGEIGFLNLSILNLPRDAAFADRGGDGSTAGGEPRGEDDPLGLYRPIPESGGWGRAQARRFLRRRLLCDPAIRAIAARTPPWFTSNHAFFFRRGAAQAP